MTADNNRRLAELAEAKAALAETREYLTAQDVRASQAETELAAERALADRLALSLESYPYYNVPEHSAALATHAEARKAKP